MSKLHTEEIENCITHSWNTRHFYDARGQFKTLLNALKKKDERIAAMKATAKKRNAQIARLKAKLGDL